MDESFLADRITKTKALIILYEDALTFLAANPTQSYRLDTGQSIQDVRRANLAELQTTLDSLYNRLCTFEARQNGAATVVQPYY
jgi:hypothetical protein